MAGLLGDYTPDPLAQGLRGFGSALLTPRAMGGGIGPGMQAFAQQAQQAQLMRRQMAQDAMREKYLASQIAENEAQTAERKRLTAAAERQLAARQGLLAQLTQPSQPGFRDASIAATGNAPAGYVPPTGRVQITPAMMAQWVASGGDPKQLEAIATAPDLGLPEVARVLEQRGSDNTPEQIREDKFGRRIGSAVPKPFEMRMQDIGGSVVPVNPFAPSALTKSMTPGDVQQAMDAAAGRGVTMRGQNMTDARARELAAIQREQTASGRVPTGYRAKPDGTLEFIPGGPADPSTKQDKFPTEVQAKDNLFARRAIESEQALIALGDKPSIAGVATKNNLSNVPLLGGALGLGANAMLSPESQRYDQAKRNFINAVLRRESGAVISEGEFKNADVQYFPQPGDSEAVKLQKAQNRRTAIDGLAAGAGPLAKDMPTLPPPGAQGVVQGWSVRKVQ